jgi:RNA polymerase sigma factor (TIGR02999 family)
MSEAPDQDAVARLLQRMADGEEDAAEALFPVVYDQLHNVARALMAKERKGHTLQTTALLHEAWVRLVRADASYESRGHFMRIAARAMRRVLVDHARKRGASKRGAGRAQPLMDDALSYWDENHTDLLALDEALGRLGERDEELLQVVELRFFSGLTLEETGSILGLSLRQVHSRWTLARGWLRRELERGVPGDG